MKKYIKQDLFDLAALTVARVHLQSGQSIESLAKRVSTGYVDTYSDYRIQEEIEAAAKKVIQYLEGVFEPKSIPNVLRHMQHSVDNFEINGERTKKNRFFNGTKFNYAKQEIQGKAESTVVRIAVFDRLLTSRSIPQAPSGWEL